MILFPITSSAPPNEVRGWMLTNPFSLAFKTGIIPPPPTVFPEILVVPGRPSVFTVKER